MARKISLDPISNRGLSRTAGRLWRLDLKPQNIYVAASLLNQDAAMRIALILQDAGFKVTSRWLRRDFSNRPTQEAWHAYVSLEEEMGRINLEDLEAADTLVLLADKPSSSGGYHVELGYFLGAKRTNIVVVGDRPNVFYWVDNVRWTLGTELLVDWLLNPVHGNNPDTFAEYVDVADHGQSDFEVNF